MMMNVLKSVLDFVLPEPAVVKCEDCWALEKCGLYLETRRPEYLPKECPNRQPRALARSSTTRLCLFRASLIARVGHQDRSLMDARLERNSMPAPRTNP